MGFAPEVCQDRVRSAPEPTLSFFSAPAMLREEQRIGTCPSHPPPLVPGRTRIWLSSLDSSRRGTNPQPKRGTPNVPSITTFKCAALGHPDRDLTRYPRFHGCGAFTDRRQRKNPRRNQRTRRAAAAEPSMKPSASTDRGLWDAYRVTAVASTGTPRPPRPRPPSRSPSPRGEADTTGFCSGVGVSSNVGPGVVRV